MAEQNGTMRVTGMEWGTTTEKHEQADRQEIGTGRMDRRQHNHKQTIGSQDRPNRDRQIQRQNQELDANMRHVVEYLDRKQGQYAYSDMDIHRQEANVDTLTRNRESIHIQIYTYIHRRQT